MNVTEETFLIKLYQTISLFDVVIKHAKSTIICSFELAEYAIILEEQKKILDKSIKLSVLPTSEKLERLKTILHHLMSFDNLLKLLHKRIWPFVSLSLEIDAPFNELLEVKKNIENEFHELRIILDIKEISEESLQRDLRVISGLLRVTKSTDKNRLQNQIHRMEKLFSDRNIYEPEDSTNSIGPGYDPVSLAIPWKLTKDEIDAQQNPMFDESLSVFRTKIKSSNKDILLQKHSYADKEFIPLIPRQLMLLSALKHPFIAPFYGGCILDLTEKTIEVCAAFEFYPEGPLYNVLRKSKTPSGTSFTITAYQIALGMEYLHSVNIINGHLTSDSIFLNNKNEPKMWNILLNTNHGEFRSLPPEYFDRGVFEFESDVYQFGLLLWEIGMKASPFKKLPEKEMKSLLLEKRKRPTFEGTGFPEGMQKLIERCLSHNPSERPSFAEIVRKFETGTIYYQRSTLEKIEKYFTERRISRANPKLLKNPEASKIAGLCQDPTKESEFILLMKNAISPPTAAQKDGDANQKKELIYELDSLGIIELMTPKMKVDNKDDKDDKNAKEIANILYFLLSSDADKANTRVKCFLSSGGDDILIEYIKSSIRKGTAYQFIEAIKAHLPQDVAPHILPAVIDDDRLDVAHTLADIAGDICIPVLVGYIPKISSSLKDLKQTNDASYLIEFYLNHVPEAKEVDLVTVSDIVKAGNISLLHKLMEYQLFLAAFSNNDAIMICQTVCSPDSKQEQKDCALLLALGLGAEFYQVVAQFKPFIDAVLMNKNNDMTSRFIARLTRFPIACEYLLTKHDVFLSHFNDPWYLTALSRIAGFYPTAVLNFPGIKDKLANNIKKEIQIEATLRLLGVLSCSKQLWEDGALVKLLFNLLSSNVTTPLESMLLLSVLSNVTPFVSFKEYFLQVLAIAESEGPLSGLAMRVLTMVELPINEPRKLQRIIILIKKYLKTGDPYAKNACSKIIGYLLALKRELRTVFLQQDFDKIIVESAMNEKDPYVFIALMSSLNKLEVEVTSQILSLFDKMLMNMSGEQVLTEFIELRKRMS